MEKHDELYEKFKVMFEGVNGECYRIGKKEDLADFLAKILDEKEAKCISLYESTLTEDAQLKEKLSQAGFVIHTEDLLTTSSTDDIGITEVNLGIAELGTLVQTTSDVDNRLCSTLVPIHIALLKTSSILAELDDVMEAIDELPQFPGFVGFITGPSRSSDIERILEIGVHGPKQVIAIMIDE